jgi:hypothetical protein
MMHLRTSPDLNAYRAPATARDCDRRAALANRATGTRAWVIASVLACSLVMAPAAGAFVYWGDEYYTIGRASLDGSHPYGKFVSFSGSTCGLAVDGRYVYWGDQLNGSIGRARLDGTGTPDPRFISGLHDPCGVAVYGPYIYWANGDAYDVTGSIGRANRLTGRDVQPEFVPNQTASEAYDLNAPCGIAVDASGIYWGNEHGDAISTANLDGTGQHELITSASSPCGIAVTGGRLVWANQGTDTIATALTSGADVDERYVTTAQTPCGVAIYGGYLYWTAGGGNAGTVNRVAITSTDPTADAEQIISGQTSPCAIAADGLFQGGLTLIAEHQRAHKLTITVRVSGPGAITATETDRHGLHIDAVHDTVRGAEQESIQLQIPRLPARDSRIHLRVTFAPNGGLPATRTAAVLVRPT